MALQSNQPLDDNIERAGCALWLNGSVYRRWVRSEQVAGIPAGIPAIPTHALQKINDDGTGEVWASGDTMPKTEAVEATATVTFTPDCVCEYTANLTFTSDATAITTVVLSGEGTNKFDIEKIDDYSSDTGLKILEQYK